MNDHWDTELKERLMRYAAIDSQSDDLSKGAPSTEIQFEILNLYKQELEEMGAKDVQVTDYGVILATMPGNVIAPKLTFWHMWTRLRSLMPRV